MGAGLSGLACALTLEKNGIFPAVFEKRDQAGDRFVNGEILLSMLNKPVKDSISYFSDIHGIYLHPVANIRKMILFSERAQTGIEGRLGFTNIRGRHANSFENQLFQQLKSKVIFDSKFTYERLLQEFTHVVMATGDAAYAAKVHNYRTDLTATLNGLKVSGNFDRHTVMAWMNNRLAPRGYGYFIPLSEKEADLVLWYPEYKDRFRQNSQTLRDQFYERACRDLAQNLVITGHFEVNNYQIGICHYPRIGNTYFTGNCFGAISPYLAFGQFTSLLTGIYAAWDLCGKGSYENLCRPLRQNYHNSLVLRRAWEQMDNRKFDLMVKFFNSLIGNKFFNTTNFDIVKLASYLARPWIRNKLSWT